MGATGAQGVQGVAGPTGAQGPTGTVAVATVSNTSTGNTISTTVNAITGATVPIINSSSLTVSNDSLTAIINGVSSNTVNLSAFNWALKGNAGTTASNFVGTTDNNPLYIKTNNNRIAYFPTGTTGNILIGANTSVPSGTDNLLLGNNTGVAGITGNSNVGLGTNVLFNNGSGAFNTGVGRSALLGNTSGSFNTAVGTQSMAANTSGNHNTVMGDFALSGDVSGSNNVAIGTNALLLNTSGSNNVSLGYDAGSQNTGSGNVFIGYTAGDLETGSNKLYIANTGTSTPLLYGDFINRHLTVNDSLTSKYLQMTNGANNGYILQSDANGNATWANPNTITTAATVSNTISGNTISTTVNGTTGTAVTVPNIYTADGTLTANRTVTMGADNLTFSSTSGNFNFTTSGGNVLMGQSVTAPATGNNIVMGMSNSSTGGYGAAVFGNANSSTGTSTLVAGYQNTASGGGAVVTGNSSTASGSDAVAMGSSLTASGNNSAAFGSSNLASGASSTAMGSASVASGYISAAIGYGDSAKGDYSFATGRSTIAASYNEASFGADNTTYTPSSATAWVATDRLFGVGNGQTTASRSDALVILKNGNTGIGLSSPAAILDVTGTAAGTSSLELRSGNSGGSSSSNQILFGYNSSSNYMHAIKSRHNSGGATGNAIDFYLWNQGTDANGTVGTKAAVTIDGNYRGMLGVGTTTPKSEVHISDGSTSLKAVTDAGGYGASLLITDNNIPRIYFEAAAQGTDQKMMGLTLLNQVLSIGTLNDNASAWQKQYIFSANRSGYVGVNTGTPDTNFVVVGAIKMVDGNQGTGKIMLSDANGVAKWVNPNTITTATTVSNTSSANTLSTTVNGVTGATVPIINTNVLSLSGNNLTSTINGVASNALNVGTIAWALTGNTGTTATSYNDASAQTNNFMGTTDNQPVEIFTNSSANNNKTDIKLYTATSTGAAVTTPSDILHIRRNGATGVNYPQVASFALGKNGSSINSETDLAIKLGNGGVYVPDVTVLTLRSNGNVVLGSGDGTGSPVGNILRGPNAGSGSTAGGNLTLNAGYAFGGGAGGSVFINGGTTGTGTNGNVYIRGGYTSPNEGAVYLNDDHSGSTFINAAGGIVTVGNTSPGVAQVNINNGLVVDRASLNNGSFSNTDATTTGNALTFGYTSGEGIASNRANATAGTNQYGLDFYTNFTRRVSISQAGNMGIGTANPGDKLEVSGNILLSAGATRTIYTPNPAAGTSANDLNINAGSTPVFGSYCTNGGNVNITAGNTNCAGSQAGGNITFTAGRNAWNNGSNANALNGDIVFYGGAANVGTSYTTQEYMRVNGTSGLVTMSTGNTATTLRVTSTSSDPNGAIDVIIPTTNSACNTCSELLEFHKSDGTYLGGIVANLSGNSVAYNTTSDERIKTNIVPTHYGVSDLMKISVKDYNRIGDQGKTLELGFIAQDLYKVLPQVVTVGGADPKVEPWQVDYGRVTPLLVKSIQDLKMEIEQLKAENQQLKSSDDKQNETIKAQQKQIDAMKAENGTVKSDIDKMKASIETLQQILGAKAQK